MSFKLEIFQRIFNIKSCLLLSISLGGMTSFSQTAAPYAVNVAGNLVSAGKFNFEWSVGKRKSLKGDYTFVIACAGTEMKSSFKVIPDNKSLSVDDVLYQLQQKGYMRSTVNEKQLLSQTLFLEVLCKMSNVTVAEGQSPLVALEKAGILKNIKFAQTGKMSIEEMNACWASFYANSKKVTLADPIFSFDRSIRTVSAVYYEAEAALMYYYDDDIETEDDANVTDFIFVLYTLFIHS